MAGELTSEDQAQRNAVDSGGDVGMSSPSTDAEAKRARRSLDAGLAGVAHSTSGPGSEVLEAPLNHDE